MSFVRMPNAHRTRKKGKGIHPGTNADVALNMNQNIERDNAMSSRNIFSK